MASTMRWRDLSRQQRAALLALGSLEVALTTTAAVDLRRRGADLVRGPKALWWLAIFVQPVGPVAYLTLGRRRKGAPGRGPLGATAGQPSSATASSRRSTSARML